MPSNPPTDSTTELLAGASIVFWDFDGVVKDSLDVKADAFERLFAPYGRAIAARVRQHHEAHGGVSRFDKIPVYLEWAGLAADSAQVQEFGRRFSALALQGVLDCPWVPGVVEYLRARCGSQTFVLVTATPQEEIEHIVAATGIAGCFREVRGSPARKASVIAELLGRWDCPAERSLMVGDTDADLAAASANGIRFLLRRTAFNRELQQSWTGPTFAGLPT